MLEDDAGVTEAPEEGASEEITDADLEAIGGLVQGQGAVVVLGSPAPGQGQARHCARNRRVPAASTQFAAPCIRYNNGPSEPTTRRHSMRSRIHRFLRNTASASGTTRWSRMTRAAYGARCSWPTTRQRATCCGSTSSTRERAGRPLRCVPKMNDADDWCLSLGADIVVRRIGQLRGEARWHCQTKRLPRNSSSALR